jgi:hypothetical protein
MREVAGSWASFMRRVMVAAAVMAALVVLAQKEEGGAATSDLQHLLGNGMPIARGTYLGLLLRNDAERDAFDDALLIRALGRRNDPLVRRLAAFQLGESEHPDARSVAALISVLSDVDEEVALQAAAALRHVAHDHPDLVAVYLTAVKPVRNYRYPSEQLNGSRQLDLRVSDVAFAALAGARTGIIAPLVAAYRAAKARGRVTAGPARNRSVELPQYRPGAAKYYLNALRLLAAYGNVDEPELILDLLNDPDSDLRSVARALTPHLGAAAARAIPTLQTAAVKEPEIAKRKEAVRTLAVLGDAGRAAVESLQTDGNPAAFVALGEHADCTSRAVASGLAHLDPQTWKIVVEALSFAQPDFDYTCLAPLVADKSLDTRTRRMAAKLVGVSSALADVRRRETIALTLLSGLSARNEALDWDIWGLIELEQEILRAVPKVLSTHRSSSPIFSAAIRTQLVSWLNSDRVCLIRFIDPGLLGRDEALAHHIATLYLSETGASDQTLACLAESLDALGDAELRRVISPESLLRKLALSEYISEADELLLARLVDRDLLASWRGELFAGKERAQRLRVADVLARRGVLSDDVLAVLIEPLGDADGPNHFSMVEAATIGLSHAGERGHAVLRDAIRGDGFEPRVAVDVLGMFVRIDASARPALQEDVLAATENVDARVRTAAVRALHYTFEDSAELVSDLVRLGGDRDYTVVDAVLKSLIDHTSEPPPIAIIARAAAGPDENLRRTAAESLAHLPKPLSAAALAITRALMVDRGNGTRSAALQFVGTLGRDGAELLREELSGPNAERLLASPGLGQAVSALGASAAILEGPLMDLAHKGRAKEQIFDVLGRLKGVSEDTIDFVTEALAAKDPEERAKAIAAILALRPDPATLPAKALAALLDSDLVPHYRRELNRVIESIRPYFGPTFASGPQVILADFPWPPPAWSSKVVVPNEYLGGDAARLGDVKSRLVNALAAANSDFEFGLFGNVPGGFALVARLEHIYPDGRPYVGLQRWSERDEPIAGLRDYIAHLFLAVPGYYRTIAFLVTNQEGQAPGSGKLPNLRIGAQSLPEEIAALTMDGRECLALIYTYRRFRGGLIAFGYDGSPSGQTHLALAGIWPALANRASAP